MALDAGAPATWWLGPPAPRAITQLTRMLQLAVLGVMGAWVLGYLGGLRLTPRPSADGTGNDTAQLFNWHPLLLTCAFPILMAEAVLAYKAPLFSMQDRQKSKVYHFGLHSAALACTILGVIAAFKSHTLKRPSPMPNLYSTHSYLGVAVLALLALQYLLGAAAYLWPGMSPAHKRALGPLHIYLGKAVFVAGIATMAVGVQEKATFVQAYGKPASLYSSVMCLPAVLQLLLLLTAMAVLFHHVPPAAAQHAQQAPQWRQQQQQQHESDGAEAALVTAQLSNAEAAAANYDERHSA